MSHSTPYTAKDIERYHSGQLSPAEMHVLEKAALDDPFLADALEGYTLTPTPTADLASLQQRLQQRVEKKERKNVFFMQGNGWMKVAALFLLIAGGGWLVFQTMSGNSERDMATNQVVKQQAPANPPALTTDSAKLEPAAPMTTQAESSNPDEIVMQPNDDIVALHREPRTKTRTPLPPATSQPAYEAAKEAAAAETSDIMTFQRQVVDSPRLNALAKTKEQEGSYKITRTDSVTNIDVVLKPTNVGVDEVVVLNKVKPFLRKRNQVVIDSLEPAEGWTHYDDYIANNLVEPEEFKTKPVKGEVELSFNINRNGEPINITVEKSLCPECDKEAIRLLKEGPKWKHLNKKGKIRIRF